MGKAAVARAEFSHEFESHGVIPAKAGTQRFA